MPLRGHPPREKGVARSSRPRRRRAWTPTSRTATRRSRATALRVLGVDPGSQATGYGVIERGGRELRWRRARRAASARAALAAGAARRACTRQLGEVIARARARRRERRGRVRGGEPALGARARRRRAARCSRRSAPRRFRSCEYAPRADQARGRGQRRRREGPGRSAMVKRTARARERAGRRRRRRARRGDLPRARRGPLERRAPRRGRARARRLRDVGPASSLR